MTAETFRIDIIVLVVQNGFPFSVFGEPAFKKLIGEMKRKLGISLER